MDTKVKADALTLQWQEQSLGAKVRGWGNRGRDEGKREQEEAYREAFTLRSGVGPTGQGGMDIPTGYLRASLG